MLLVVNVLLLFSEYYIILYKTLLLLNKIKTAAGKSYYLYVATLLEFTTENVPVLLNVTFRFILFTVERWLR